MVGYVGNVGADLVVVVFVVVVVFAVLVVVVVAATSEKFGLIIKSTLARFST